MKLVKILVFITVIAVGFFGGVHLFSKTNACFFCSSPDVNSVNTVVKEAAITEENQRMLINNQPIPHLEKSQERKNLIERLNRFNSDDKISYIYLVNFGKVMAFYTIKGKVSSVNSLLTTPDQLIDANGDQCSQHWSDGQHCQKVSSPDIDGSYGSNGDAIFFFTTDDAYVEWKGDYMLSDQPLKLTTQPELIRTIK